MKILVAAKALRLDTGSEGICTSKFLAALTGAGHDVLCLTSERLEGEGARPVCPWLPQKIAIKHVGQFSGRGLGTSLSRFTNKVAGLGTIGAWFDRKINALVAYSTGYPSHVWHEVECWRRAIQQIVGAATPDVVITRAAGTQFEPHIAMSMLRLSVPWIANYHDPFPVSLYPPPYRRHFPVISWLQERLHRRIVHAANVLTFPSERLLRWVLQGSLERHRAKAFVVPHIAAGLPGIEVDGLRSTPSDNGFTIVHTGTLLHQRNPQPLLRAFLEFLHQDPRRCGRARLVFVGRARSNHLAYPEWASLEEAGAVQRLEHRVPYHVALDMTQSAAALVVLEADCPESPFFPAKLADYLWLRRPILALSPRHSSTADILGGDYPLLIAPDDTHAITAALESLWHAWTEDRLTELAPSVDRAAFYAPRAVQSQLDRVLDFARRVPLGAPRGLAPEVLSTP